MKIELGEAAAGAFSLLIETQTLDQNPSFNFHVGTIFYDVIYEHDRNKFQFSKKETFFSVSYVKAFAVVP